MYLHRFTIGILFNEKMFRLSSLHGELTDRILQVRGRSSHISESYYTKVTNHINLAKEPQLLIHDDDGSNSFGVHQREVIFKRVTEEAGNDVDTTKAIKEFKELWRAANKTMDFPATRRIGFVAEFRVPVEPENSSCLRLIESLTKFSIPGSSTSFNLSFEATNLGVDGKVHNKTTDDFWNSIYSFYNSERDETPDENSLNANVDIQKFYNPAKLDPIKELKSVEARFKDEKEKFATLISQMGLTNK